uniref:Sodium/potassium-transporting ATPase subunit beta-1 n=1 Tax=Ascaris suum TaxID=6253 RepID=F1L780_ASCSU
MPLKSGQPAQRIKVERSSKSRNVEKHIRERTERNRLRSLQLFLWHNGRICGRKPLSWLLSLLYLLALWSLIGLLCFAMMRCLLYMAHKKPLFYGKGSFIGARPGISYEPLDRSSGSPRIIRWNPNTTIYSGILRDYLEKTYSRRSKKKYVNCRNPSELSNNCTDCACMQNAPLCAVDVSDSDPEFGFGDCALSENTTFGFKEGSPCILLRLNKIIGYYPSPTSNGIAALDARNGEILLGGEGPKNSTGSKPCCNEENLRFKCEIQGEGNYSVSYFPASGFPYCFFPYCQQTGYKQPFIMVKVGNLQREEVVKLRCIATPPDMKGAQVLIPLQFTD